MSASKRPLAVRRLKIVLVPGGAHAITVQPDERDKTVHDWLVCLLEPVEDAAPLDAMTLKIQHDVAYESLVEPNTTLEEVGLFVKESGTVVLKEEWGRSVADGGRQAMDARDQAISQAIAEMGGEGVEEQLRFVKSRVRGSPARWVVELAQKEPTYRIGDDICVTFRCVDAIGLSAYDLGDTKISVAVSSVPAELSSAFAFAMELRKAELTDTDHQQGDAADAATFAWRGQKILCLPKEQPRGREQPFTLTVTDGAGRSGTSGPFFIEEEAVMGDASSPQEIDAKLVHTWYDEKADIKRAPHSAGLITGSFASERGVHVIRHPSAGQVLRELRTFPSSSVKRREFFKDLTVWQLVGGSCGGKVAEMTKLGWYFDQQSERAGFCMKEYAGSLDEKLRPELLMAVRFNLCDQVLQIMADLQVKFPFLMFPDIKPKNFLYEYEPQSSGDASFKIVLTDLDDVRPVGSLVSTNTQPYRHPQWKPGVPTKKLFEQHAVAVTLLQILLAMPSPAPPAQPPQIRATKWSPTNLIQSKFRDYSSIALEGELRRLRDHCREVLDDLGDFFLLKAGNLKAEDAEEGEDRYSQMRDELILVAEREKNFRGKLATSTCQDGSSSFELHWPPSSSNGPGFWLGSFTTQTWQVELRSMVAKWERELHGIRLFQDRDYNSDLLTLQVRFQKLQKAIGDQHNALNREHIMAEARHISEAVLNHLARRMRRRPDFDPKGALGDDWPNIVLKQLEQEMKSQGERKLASIFYDKIDQSARAYRSWVIKGESNLERLHSNLHNLRNDSNDAHHPLLPDGSREFSFIEVHGTMERMGLLFSTSDRHFTEPRILD